MNLVQNEFILLTNAYYQAQAYSQNMLASEMYGNITIQSELNQFREQISQSSDTLLNLIQGADNKGETDKLIIKMKMTEIYKVSEHFLVEIENSINDYKIIGGDMNAYRICFQMGSDYIYQFVGGALRDFGDHVNSKDGIHSIIETILNQNYWEGSELKEQINFIQNIRNKLNYSENWLKEYAYKMFVN